MISIIFSILSGVTIVLRSEAVVSMACFLRKWELIRERFIITLQAL